MIKELRQERVLNIKEVEIMKKLVSAILAAVLFVGTPVFADENRDYESAVKTVKYYFDVEDYDTFNCNVMNMDGGKYYELEWTNKDDDSRSVYAVTDTYGRVCSYQKYFDYSDNEIAEMSKAEAAEIAKSFIKKIYGDKSADYRIVEQGSYDRESYVYFKQYYNGIPVEYNTITVSINNADKSIIGYTANPYAMDIDLPKSEALIDANKAKAIYLDKVGLELKYYLGYGKNRGTIYAAYESKSSDNYVNAYTGEVFTPYSDYSLYDGAAGMAKYENAMDMSASEADDIKLSEGEINEINKLSTAITPAKAVKAVNSAFGTNYSSNNLVDEYRKSNDGEYIISIRCDLFSASVKNDGTVLSYYVKDTSTNKAKFDGKTLSQNLVKKLAAKYDYRLDEENNKYSDDNTYYYNRYVNNIESLYDYITVGYNNSGKLISYYRTNMSYEYPDVSSAISADKAFNLAKERYGYSLKYILNKDKTKAILAYGFDESFKINDKGIFVDYSGSEVKPEINGYSDIDGLWCEKAVEYIYNRGYRFDGEEFMCEKSLTELDFFKLMSMADESKEAYDFAKNNLGFSGRQNPEHILTRYELAKYLCYNMGYGELAKKDIFKSSFSDVDDENNGFVAICSANEIMNGVGNDKFDGNSEVNRGQMAQALYNALRVKR